MDIHEEIDGVIGELEVWHRIRDGLNRKPDRKRKMIMDTLPRTIELLKKLKGLV